MGEWFLEKQADHFELYTLRQKFWPQLLYLTPFLRYICVLCRISRWPQTIVPEHHVIGMETVAEQLISKIYSEFHSLKVRSHLLILAKSTITHLNLGQSKETPPKKILKGIKMH